MNFKECAKNLEMEEDEFLEMMDLFIKTCCSDLNQLEAAISRGDAPQVAKSAHSIKGAAANLGLMEIYEVAKKTEIEARENRLDGVTEMVETIKEKVDLIAETLAIGSKKRSESSRQ